MQGYYERLAAALLPMLADRALIRDAIISAVFIISLMICRSLIRSAILRRHDLGPEVRRRWVVYLRNCSLGVFALGMIFIWGHEIQTFAVSLVAIAAAIVLATKEMILCMLGSIFRSSSNAFAVGDRVEIGGIRGQVIDMNLVSTTLMESSHASHRQGTVGRGVTVPNSLLLSQPVFNESMLGDYVLQTIHVAILRNDDWERAERVLMEAGDAIAAEYAQDLSRHARELERRYALESPMMEPRVRIFLDHYEEIGLQLQIAVPLGHRARIEQRVLRLFLQGMSANKPFTKSDVK
ncbi:mechanosensitive ion channel family protein [Iodobacter fluviatilis]|uniref:Mechanosensitive ion channel n=1 Tax=Iodobacter fluviatilis TaxID=537 RepID=A0A377QAL2_9NEIS|nr:mechanosensitive ion channel family protein [Iodobacter fluviatilis]TCU82404.1 mechanosensitive ion channel-like protein [Iodobacter fluviatilis]STQ91629.1 Mechanosensitive ion channel [Iodobacter fluviatilis]